VRALFVHHDANSLPGHVGRAVAGLGAEVVTHQVCATPGSPVGSPDFPDPADVDLVVLFGSRWSVDDDRVAHWVEPELDFLRAADRSGTAVLGLCFGGQVLAAALGGSVGRTPHPEIGWVEVEVLEPGRAEGIEAGPWLQWHFDAFTVPAGGVELARSPAGLQAFRLRRNLGLQFHPEADRAVLESWMEDDLDQLVEAGLDADALLYGADRHRDAALDRARRLVGRVAAGLGRNKNVF
jgi:GMP synthase-like glutamine amidotransferase